MRTYLTNERFLRLIDKKSKRNYSSLLLRRFVFRKVEASDRWWGVQRSRWTTDKTRIFSTAAAVAKRTTKPKRERTGNYNFHGTASFRFSTPDLACVQTSPISFVTEKGRPFSACNIGNRRRLHAGNSGSGVTPGPIFDLIFDQLFKWWITVSTGWTWISRKYIDSSSTFC